MYNPMTTKPLVFNGFKSRTVSTIGNMARNENPYEPPQQRRDSQDNGGRWMRFGGVSLAIAGIVLMLLHPVVISVNDYRDPYPWLAVAGGVMAVAGIILLAVDVYLRKHRS